MSGPAVILCAYLIYAIVATGLFALLPAQRAALAAYCSGWLLLPVAIYEPATLGNGVFTYEVIGTALPTDLLVTKALVIPLVIVVGTLWRARSAFRGLSFTLADGAMAAFCLSPLLAMAAGHVGAGDAIVQLGYLAGVWGGSWLIGRVLLNDAAGQRDLVRAMAYSGLALIPFALVEGLKGPRLYNLLYGHHPFYGDGVTRYFGARPLGLFEHGNQYGIWIAMAALAANSLALRRETRSRWTIAMAVALSLCAIASQSIGAIILAATGTIWLMMSARARRPMRPASMAWNISPTILPPAKPRSKH